MSDVASAVAPGQQGVEGAMQPVIFLDVDGVIVTTRLLLLDFEPGEKDLIYLSDDGLPPPLDGHCVARLKALVKRSRARIVVTSTWRLEPEYLTALKVCFLLCGAAYERKHTNACGLIGCQSW
jgi:hypothetical protein